MIVLRTCTTLHCHRFRVCRDVGSCTAPFSIGSLGCLHYCDWTELDTKLCTSTATCCRAARRFCVQIPIIVRHLPLPHYSVSCALHGSALQRSSCTAVLSLSSWVGGLGHLGARIPDSHTSHRPLVLQLEVLPRTLRSIRSSTCNAPHGIVQLLKSSQTENRSLKKGFLYPCVSLVHCTSWSQNWGLWGWVMIGPTGSRRTTPIQYTCVYLSLKSPSNDWEQEFKTGIVGALLWFFFGSDFDISLATDILQNLSFYACFVFSQHQYEAKTDLLKGAKKLGPLPLVRTAALIRRRIGCHKCTDYSCFAESEKVQSCIFLFIVLVFR